MTIKSKLIANVLLTAVLIVLISLTSFFSMRFLQQKLSYLTEQSTPFQIRTIEFQRELQACISSLVKVNVARTMKEFALFQSQAENSLYRIESQQQMLDTMGGRSSNVSEELSQLALELFTASEERINSTAASTAANADVLLRMKELSARLGDLDSYISNLQSNYSKAYTSALENTGTHSNRLRSIEELRNLIRELQLITVTVQNAQTGSTVLIAKGKLKSLAGRISKNEYYTSNKPVAAVTDGFTDRLAEYIRLQSVAMSKMDEASKITALLYGKDLPYKLNDLFQTLDQDTMLARDELALAHERQGNIYTQTDIVNDILVANSQLVAMGLRVTAETSRLFSLDSSTELVKLDSEIRSHFIRIHEQIRMLEGSLTKLNSAEELKILHAAGATLAVIRTKIYSDNGIITTLKKKLSAIEQANRSSDKLREILIRQTAKGNENVQAARGEQEKSIAAVNSMVKKSLAQISGVGSIAIVIGMLFGFWIYRSVLPPLRVVLDSVRSQQLLGMEKASLAEAVAGGDFSREVKVSNALELDPVQLKNDEMGKVLKAVVGMSEAQAKLDSAFADMTASLFSNREQDARRSRIRNGLYELNILMRGEQKTDELAERALAFMAEYLGAGVGVLYLYDERDKMLSAISTYAVSHSRKLNDGLKLGESLAGQVAQERKMIYLTSVPPDYLPISSALGESDPLAIAIMPIIYNGTLVGVCELGSFKPFGDDDLDFLKRSLEGFAVAVSVNRSRQLVNELLEQSQQQAEELRVQQEELQQTNEELEERSRMLVERKRVVVESA